MSGANRNWTINIIKFLVLTVLLAACSVTGPTPSSSRTLSNDLAVAPEFEKFFNKYNGIQVFGLPISAAFEDPATSHLIQYFQHLRLEFDQSARSVFVTPLGEYYQPTIEEQTPVSVTVIGRQQRFPETDIVVQDAFLTFFESNGGRHVFGLPITPLLDEGGELVQYFENGQLKWNPNASPAFRVEVAPLASAYYWQFGSPVTDSFTRMESILEADVQATLKEPILYAGEEQVLYVTVITPDSLQLVEGATIQAMITYGDNSTEIIFTDQTDELGQAQNRLDLPGVEPGDTVKVEIQASGANGVIGSTMLSFKAWW